MTAVAVTFDGTRLDDSDANTDWSNFPSGGQAPSAEANNKYQGANVVNQKLSSTSLDGLSYLHPSTTDMTAANRNLFYAKIYVTDFGALDATYGLSASIGLDASNRRNYNVGGTGSKISRFNTYPARGGYFIAPINPSVTGWIDNTTGTVSAITAIDFFGAQADWLASANAKSENFCLDAIDVGNGLTLLNGTGADPAGDFPDFVAADQDQATNGRWGICFGAGTFVEAQGMLVIGASGTATEFDDSTSQVLFLDSYVAAGDFGVTSDIGNASSVIAIGCSITGLGAAHTEADTRPDHIVTGTAGTYTLTGTLSNHRNVTFTSACTVDGAVIQCLLLTQGSADIKNSTIQTTSLTNVATLQDPVFGVTTDLNNTTFVQSGAGHAIEIDTAGTYNLQDIIFSGYGGTPGSNLVGNSGAADAAIVNTSNGAVTINVNGNGNQPSVRNVGASATTTVNQTVTVTIKVVDTLGAAIQGAKVLLETDPGGTDIISYGITDSNGEVSTSYGGSTPQAVKGFVRKGSVSPVYKPSPITATITSSGLAQTITLVSDE